LAGLNILLEQKCSEDAFVNGGVLEYDNGDGTKSKFIVMEKMSGDITDFSEYIITYDQRKIICLNVLFSLKCMDNKYCFADIKPANILYKTKNSKPEEDKLIDLD